jgi:hypothetical protein
MYHNIEIEELSEHCATCDICLNCSEEKDNCQFTLNCEDCPKCDLQ